MKRSKQFGIASIALLALQAPEALAASGWITPETIKMNILSADLATVDGMTEVLLDEAKEHTFSAAATDFSASNLGPIDVPVGRFKSVRVCYQTSRKIRINGSIYRGDNIGQGSGATALNDGDPVYTVGTGSSLAVSNTDPGGANVTEVTYGDTNGTCATSIFQNTVCVTKSGTDGCQASDTVVTQPDLYLVLNMSHAVGVQGDGGGATTPVVYNNGIYPIATLGKPGAAMFLSRLDTSGMAKRASTIALLFTADGKLQFTQGQSNLGETGFCQGQGSIAGSKNLALYEASVLGGRVQYPANTGGTMAGMMTITGVNQAAGSDATVTCVDDSLAVPPYLGESYTGGPGVAGSSTWKVQKIVDPSGSVFGSVCPAPGVCGSAP